MFILTSVIPMRTLTNVICCFLLGSKLWRHFDTSVVEARKTQNITADATVEVQRYLAEPNIERMENPLSYWERQKRLYPNLYKLALSFLSTPASSVPCERVFSKAGEVVSKKKKSLKTKNCGETIVSE